MLYGSGAKKQLAEVKDAENKRLTATNFLQLKPLVESCSTLVEQEIEQYLLDSEYVFSDLLWWNSDRTRVGCGDVPAEWMDQTSLVTKEDWLIWVETGLEPEIWIHGRLSHLLWMDLEQGMTKQRLLLQDVTSYQIEFIQHHPDFQQILNMRYCNYLLNNLGVEGTLPLTLTMPLGAVEITLLDAAMLYSGLLTGQRTMVDDDSQKGNVLIERIEGPSGELLFEALPKTQQVSNFVSGMLLSNILHNVVQHGTGRRAKYLKTAEGIPIPVIGKTGTTNGYKNAAFIGMIPKAEAGSWVVGEGVTVATYVGFDTPTSMRFGRYKLSGSSGALPVWIETAKGVSRSEFIGQPKEGMSFEAPQEYGFHGIQVNDKTGSLLDEGLAETWVYNATVLWGQEPTHIRAFSPVDANEVPEWNASLTVLRGQTEDDEVSDVRLVPTKMDVVPSEMDSGFEQPDIEHIRLVPDDDQ